MAALKVVLYFVSGFAVIAGAVCAGIFFHNGSVPALGSGALLLCLGFAGILVSITPGAVSDELCILVNGSQTLIASITHESCR